MFIIPLTVNISRVNQLSTVQKTKAMHDRELFWHLFCRCAAENMKENPNFCFKKEKYSNEIHFSGDVHYIKTSRTLIEEIRLNLVEAEAKGLHCTVYVLEQGSKTFLTVKAERLLRIEKYFDLSFSITYLTNLITLLIEPALATLAKELQIKLRCEKYESKILHGENNVPTRSYKFQQFRNSLNHHDLYLRSICCDFTLVVEGVEIPVHSSMLFLNGGPKIKAALESQMIEQTKKTYPFPEFKETSVRAYLNYVYFGEEKAFEYIEARWDVDWIDFLKLTDYLLIDPLKVFAKSQVLKSITPEDKQEWLAKLEFCNVPDLISQITNPP